MSSPDSIASPVDSLVSIFTSAASISTLASSADVAVNRASSSASLSSSSTADDFSLQRRLVACVASPPRRPDTQHLAVLISRDLWKPDREEQKCNTFHCRKPFSLFERKHHCRRCGGVFCHDCSAQVTPLLDTSRLSFIYPPNNVPVERFATPQNPMRPSRVCDDCYEELHGTLPDRQRELRKASSVTYVVQRPPVSRSNTTDGNSLTSKSKPKRRTSCSSSPTKSLFPRAPPTPTEEPDPFAGYPLRVPSAICKANGGGRWVATPQPIRYDFRPVGGKALWEIKMEKDEERKRRKRENPIVIDGEFRVRERVIIKQHRKRKTSSTTS